MLFVTDVVGRDRKLSWKVGLGASRLARDLRALCNVRGISLKKMRETRDELIGGVARLLTRGEEVKQFIFNADLVDEAVANLRGFSSFHVAPIIIERVLHEACAEIATVLLNDYDEARGEHAEKIGTFLRIIAQRLVTERSPKSDAAVAEFYRRKIITEDDMPRDLKESIRAQTLADALVREPSQFLLTLDLIGDPETYAHELSTLESAMATLARRAEAVALLAAVSAAPDAPYADAAAAGVRKILDVLDPATRARARALADRVWVNSPPTPTRAVRSALEQAMVEQRVVRIRYVAGDGAASTRDVEPIMFGSSGGRWYLIGWCRLRAGIRWFLVDRVKRASVTTDPCGDHGVEEVGPPPVTARSMQF